MGARRSTSSEPPHSVPVNFITNEVTGSPLRSNGVGNADFGMADIEVIPQVTALIGDPVDDQLGEYPAFDIEYGVYVDFEDTGFSAPFGRTTCYDNEFCLYFGGSSGEIAGVQVLVTSQGVPFSSVDDAGNFVTQTPDPAEIFVDSMRAGEEPFFLFSDC